MIKKKEKNITNVKLLESINRSFSKIEEKMATKDDIKDIRKDILNLGDRFVSYHTFDVLTGRVKVLEEKKQK